MLDPHSDMWSGSWLERQQTLAVNGDVKAGRVLKVKSMIFESMIFDSMIFD